MNKPPFSYEIINAYNGSFAPSTVHCKNTGLVRYFRRYLFNKVLSTYEIKGIPEDWAFNYFQTVLFAMGYIAIINTDKYGIIPQMATLGGFNVFYQPQWAIIVNPKIQGIKRPIIDEDCAIIKIFPDYNGIMDVVNTYADLMALTLESTGVNLINSKFAYVFASDTKAQAESFKKMYDNIASGEPAQFIDKKLFDEDGKPRWIMFSQNIGQNYITDRLLVDFEKIDNQFDTLIGIPNANTSKKERLITDEVNANNEDTGAMPTLIVETASQGMKKANKMFGLDLSIRYRYEKEIIKGESENGNIDTNRVI